MITSRFRLHLQVAFAFIATLAFGGFLIHLDEDNHVLQNQKIALDIAAIHGHSLQEHVDRSLSSAYALAALLRQGDGEIKDFDRLASEMLRLYGSISSLQLAPNGVVKHIVPLAGNEAAIGHDLLKDPKRNKEAFAAVATKRLTLAGPFALRQGGIAIVGRLPVFLTDYTGDEYFWGFTTALIKIADLLKVSELSSIAGAGYAYELSRIHPDTGQRDVFASSSPRKEALKETVSYAIEVPNGQWTLSIGPENGWHSAPATLAMEAGVVLLAGILLALPTWKVLMQPYVLKVEVAARTRELSEANGKLEAEIAEHRQAEGLLRDSEGALRAARDELEMRVAGRTAELTSANAALTQEIEGRKRVEAALKQEHERQQTLIKKLEDAHNQLLQSEKMASIGQLAAGVAHEINNPIGFVNSNLGTLQKYVADFLDVAATYEQFVDPLLVSYPVPLAKIDAAKENADFAFLRDDLPNLLSETRDGVLRVKKIVQDLKEFSHVDENEWQVADLHRGLDSTLGMVWNEIKYKAEVIKEYGEILPVECLASQLNQVFMNLLLNAAQAIEVKGVITIRSAMEENWVRIDIEDTGTGIAPDNLNRIFDPFFTTKPVGKGTGLGLSLSYGIIEKHGGRIAVQSEVGKGSLFQIWLPVCHADAESASPPRACET